MPTRPVTDADTARALMTELSNRAARSGIVLRAPPPEPTTCCSRGCNGCVWEGYFAAVDYWREEVLEKLSLQAGLAERQGAQRSGGASPPMPDLRYARTEA